MTIDLPVSLHSMVKQMHLWSSIQQLAQLHQPHSNVHHISVRDDEFVVVVQVSREYGATFRLKPHAGCDIYCFVVELVY